MAHITFADGSAGTAAATWGQQAIWDVVRTLGSDAARYNVSVCLPVDGMPVPAVLDALRQLCYLHDSLRTRLLCDDAGQLIQIVDPAGTMSVPVRECAADDVESVGAALLAELADRPFDCAREWGMRVGLVESAGLVRRIAFSLSHTAVDAWGLVRLAMNLTSIAQGESGAQVMAARPSMQPLAEAAFQASDRGRRLDANARRHWRTKLDLGPRRLFPPGGAASEMFPNAQFNSPALAVAAERVAAGYQVSSSSVLLAAAASMTSQLSGSPDVVFQIVVNNRFLPGLTNAVSTLAQEGLFHVVDAHLDFADVIRRTHKTSLSTYRNSYYDRRLLLADIEAAGETADHSCFVNDTRSLMPTDRHAPTESLAKLRSRTTLRWPIEFEPRRNVTFAMDLIDVPDSIELSMTADSALVPKPDMERFLCGIEDLVIEAAIAIGAE
ncbi:MAG TPA: condensation domain-containing protein [Pseudonocardiaceae bacterium]|nr:condensation domain-containing protein [Pseudonocardiaceae bacterium]